MWVLYDSDLNHFINISDLKIERSHNSYMINSEFEFKVSYNDSEYIKSWYLSCMKQGSRIPYKRNISICNITEPDIKKIKTLNFYGCFVKSIEFSGMKPFIDETTLDVALMCDYSEVEFSLSPRFKSLYRNRILEQLGI
jgi:hypothetical protein